MSSFYSVVRVVLVLAIVLTLGGPVMQDESCGTWNLEWITREPGEGISISNIQPNLSAGCRNAYRLENRTQVWGQGGYTIALQPFPFDALVEWNPDARIGEAVYLTRYIPIEMRVNPASVDKEGLVNLQGYMSVESVAIDISILLLETALSGSESVGCLIESSDEVVFSLGFRTYDIVREVALLTLEGDMLGAQAELMEVGENFYRRAIEIGNDLRQNCIVAILDDYIKAPLYLLDIGVAYLSWVGTVFLNLFEHGTEPVGVHFRYLPQQSGDATAGPAPTPLPEVGEGTIVFDSTVNGEWQVFSIKPDGSSLRQLTDVTGGIGDPAISPDGASIVFLSDGGKRLNVMDSSGGNIRSIYETATEVGWPNWSPDSQTIVFASVVDGYKNLHTISSDGSGLARRTQFISDDLAPAFSPNGDQIVFSSNRSGMWEIHFLNLITGAVTQITNNRDPNGQGWPVWSPDGGTILFEAPGEQGESDIFAISPNGSGLVNLTKHPVYDGAPAWSPDGSQIVFVSRRDDSLNLYLMGADGSAVQRLTTIWAWGPTWSRR